MPLDANQTKEATRAYVRQVFVESGYTANVDTDAVSSAVTAIVSFIETNTTAINNALPEPFKSVATTVQKRHLVGLVAAKLAGLI